MLEYKMQNINKLIKKKKEFIMAGFGLNRVTHSFQRS